MIDKRMAFIVSMPLRRLQKILDSVKRWKGFIDNSQQIGLVGRESMHAMKTAELRKRRFELSFKSLFNEKTIWHRHDLVDSNEVFSFQPFYVFVVEYMWP